MAKSIAALKILWGDKPRASSSLATSTTSLGVSYTYALNLKVSPKVTKSPKESFYASSGGQMGASKSTQKSHQKQGESYG